MMSKDGNIYFVCKYESFHLYVSIIIIYTSFTFGCVLNSSNLMFLLNVKKYNILRIFLDIIFHM